MIIRGWQVWILCILAVVYSNMSTAVLAKSSTIETNVSASSDYVRLETLTNKILREQLEILKQSIKVRLNSSQNSRLKKWRICAYNLGNSSATLGGLISVASEKFRTLNDPRQERKVAVIAGPISILIGNSVTLAGLTTESMLDAIAFFKRKKKGNDLKAITNKVLISNEKVQSLIHERKELISNSGQLDPVDKKSAEIEERVLSCLQKLAIAEYIEAFVNCKKRGASRKAAYLSEYTASASGGYLGALLALLSDTQKNAKLAIPAGIGFTISGVCIAQSPTISRYAGKLFERYSRKRISRLLGNEGNCASLEFRDSVDLLIQSFGDNQTNRRADLYQKIGNVCEQLSESLRKEKKEENRDYCRRVFVNGVVGGTQTAAAIQLIDAAALFDKSAANADKLLSNRIAATETTFIPGASTWLANSFLSRSRPDLQVYSMGTQRPIPRGSLTNAVEKLELIQNMLNNQAKN